MSMQVAEKSDVIFIAVKPQYVGIVLKEMKGQLNKDSIIVSIAAGVPLAAMKVRDPEEICASYYLQEILCISFTCFLLKRMYRTMLRYKYFLSFSTKLSTITCDRSMMKSHLS